MKQIWHYLLAEPFMWIFCCFFQPDRFSKEFETEGFFNIKRIVPMLRIIVPAFIIAYLFSLVSHFILISFSIKPSSNLLNMLLFTLIGILEGSILGIIAGNATGIIVCITLGSISGIYGGPLENITVGIAFGITYSILVCLATGIRLGIPLGIAIGLMIGSTFSIVGEFPGCITFGIAFGFIVSTTLDIEFGFTLIAVLSLANIVAVSIVDSIVNSIIATSLFILSYLIGYYRIPLYPISSLSSMILFICSWKKPELTFTYIHSSSVYWDENVYFPLPGLKCSLRLFAKQDIEQTLKEIGFILHERRDQVASVRVVLWEIVIHDLEMRKQFRDIAQAHKRISEILSQDLILIEPRLATPFLLLREASLNAEHYYMPNSHEARQKAVQNLVENLNKEPLYSDFQEVKLKERLNNVTGKWLRIAQEEQEKFAQGVQSPTQIENPYNAGHILELRDSLFVGRQDIVKQLEEALGRGEKRPTFLLNGERRMGKSSTLKQLPSLLNKRYIPIFYNLESPSLLPSISVFLGAIAETIYESMAIQGMQVKRLKFEQLEQADRINEGMVYNAFDKWLIDVEKHLNRENCTLLLAFDEFEKLEVIMQKQYFDLNLLLGWFRSVIQNRPRLALLFSGVKTFAEMNTNWVGYFVNVQALKVSFLKEEDARKLILQPIPSFLGEEIFTNDVVENILLITHCHPFMIQALCAYLIDNLNVDNRSEVSLQDVENAINQVVENWDSYFRDLWLRSDEDQKACLIAIQQLDTVNISQIQLSMDKDERVIRKALQTLLKRDLIFADGDIYFIAVPIFKKWIELNHLSFNI